MRELCKFIIMLFWILSCRNEDQIQGRFLRDKQNVYLQIQNTSESGYYMILSFINVCPIDKNGLISVDQNCLEVDLKKIDGFTDIKSATTFSNMYRESLIKNGFLQPDSTLILDVGIKKYLENMFILLPKKSSTTFILNLKNAQNDKKYFIQYVNHAHYGRGKIAKKRAKVIDEFYSSGIVNGYKPYGIPIKINPIVLGIK